MVSRIGIEISLFVTGLFMHLLYPLFLVLPALFGLTSSLLFVQRFGRYALRPSSGISCQTREPSIRTREPSIRTR